MSGSSTYSLLMRCSTSTYTLSCGYGRSVVDAPLLNTVPTTSSSMTKVEVVTTRYLIRLFIYFNSVSKFRGPGIIIAGTRSSISPAERGCPQGFDGAEVVLVARPSALKRNVDSLSRPKRRQRAAVACSFRLSRRRRAGRAAEKATLLVGGGYLSGCPDYTRLGAWRTQISACRYPRSKLRKRVTRLCSA